MKTTYRVLKILKENKDKPISGQFIADSLGISRTAVWKAIKSLEDNGNKITSLAAKGYILEKTSTKLNEDNIRYLLPYPFNESYIDIYELSTSTNALAKEVMEKGENACLIISKEQSNGKGRFGKSFYSPKGGLYFSYSYKPDNINFDASLLTMAIGVSVAETFKELYDIDLQIKWVNDLFYKDKKVAGILTEASFNMETSQIDYITCGIGINLTINEKILSTDLKDIAGPVFPKLPKDFDANILISKIIENFIAIKDCQKNIIEKYSKICLNLGQDIIFTINDKDFEGTAKDISSKGELVVELKNGKVQLLTFGQAKIKKKELK